jgi:hypothetical protein
LEACGLQLAGPVTPALDSNLSILLLRSPHWLPVLVGTARGRPDPELVETVALLRSMLVGARLTRPRLKRLAAVAADMAAIGLENPSAGEPVWPPQKPFQVVAEYLTKRPRLEPGPFGWKYPGMFLFLPELLEAFPRARYIHVLRHPLDVAWSSNTGGVRLWAPIAGIDPAEIDERPENAQLAWWLYSTRMALAAGRDLRDRFMLVRLEQLVERPRAVARRLAAFAGLDPDGPALKRAVDAVESPGSIGRHAGQPLDVFDPRLLADAQGFINRWYAPAGPRDESPEAEDEPSAVEDKSPEAEDEPPEAEDEPPEAEARTRSNVAPEAVSISDQASDEGE